MTNSPRRLPTLRPSSELLVHEIRFVREKLPTGVIDVVATVQCERHGCTVDVEGCGYCERFARVDTHEAGYVLLCRSSDEPLMAESSRRPPTG